MRRFSEKPSIICFGELLWDLLPGGARLGGAPANCAVNIHDLGGESHLLSAVGDDELGEKAVGAISQRGMPVDLLQVLGGVDTGAVGVCVDGAGIASYTVRDDVAWAEIMLTKEALALASRVDAFCYGSLVQAGKRSCATLRALLEATREDCLRFFDVNLRKPFVSAEVVRDSLKYASILKLNEEEVSEIGSLLGLKGDEKEILSGILNLCGAGMILVTRGDKGADVVTRNVWIHVDAAPVLRLVDTVGAGDAFSAAFLLEFLRGGSLEGAARAGVQHASRICEIAGGWLPRSGLQNK